MVHEHVALAQHGEEVGWLVRRRWPDGAAVMGAHGLLVQVGAVEGVHAPQAAEVERGAPIS